MKQLAAIAAYILSFAHVRNAITLDGGLSSEASIEAMEHVFFRSEETRAASMASIMRTMTTARAMHFLRAHHLSSPALVQAANLVQSKKALRSSPTGYAALEGAKKMLNDMIFNGSSKYDLEIAVCTDFYMKQCAAMDVCRGTIAGANTICANSRALILDSQACIARAEEDITQEKESLKNLLVQCQHEISAMKERLKVLDGDLEVLTSILEMTDCDKSFVQIQHLQLLKCVDPCSKKTYFTFDHDALQKKVSALQSTVTHDLLHESFGVLFKGIQALKLLQSGDDYTPAVNTTRWNNKPVPRTEVPADPCKDPNHGAPSLNDKRAAKCSITNSPQCYKLQERFLLIQSGVQDEHDELLDEIAKAEQYCQESKETLLAKISNNQKALLDCQTKLAESTEKEATSAEEGRTTTQEHEELDAELKHKMKSCSTNYINFETEICAYKKIRGELYKMKGAGDGFFQDCVVSKWSAQSCSASCGGGMQMVQRSVMIHPNEGAGCLPLEMEKTCNEKPCPVDCELEAWAGWSKCSAQCGGGVEQRLREVKVAPKYDGKPCGSTSQTRSCSNQACEKNCELTDWTAWTTCSKDCDGGSMKREKYMKHAAEGAGKCPDMWSVKRLEYKECNKFECRLNASLPTITCNRSMDIVLLIDGSGSLGPQGWNAEIKAANTFVDAFIAGGADAEIAVILFSGPRTWSGVDQCIGQSGSNVDIESVCQIKTITHFTSDLQNVKTLISGMTWPQGSTLTSVALLSAKNELSMGRKDSHSTMIVFTDGRPLSYRKTMLASREVRKVARLVWVPVTKFAPLKDIKQWATRRWEENVVVVKSFGDLENPDVVTRIVANICPSESASVEYIPGTQQPYR